MTLTKTQFDILRVLYQGLPVKDRLSGFSDDLVIQMDCDGLIDAIASDEKGGIYAITDTGRKAYEHEAQNA